MRSKETSGPHFQSRREPTATPTAPGRGWIPSPKGVRREECIRQPSTRKTDFCFGDKRNLVTPQCLLLRSKQTLDDAYSEQFCNVAAPALSSTLPLPERA